MTTPQKLDLLLNRIEMNCDLTIGGKTCNEFMMECLSLIQSKLPPIAVEAFRVSNDYLAGRAKLRSVTGMLEKCWEYLHENHQDQKINQPEVSAIRAVICLLHAQAHPQERDIVDQLSFFLTLVNNVESQFDREEFLLRRHFAECLTTG